MPDPKSTQIRDALITEIKKVVGIGTVSSDLKLWQEEARLPAVYLIEDSERSDRAPTRSKEVQGTYRAVAVLQSEQPQKKFEALRRDIETQIEDDPSLGGLALDAWRSSTGPFATTTSNSGQVYVREIFIEVIYRHARAAP